MQHRMGIEDLHAAHQQEENAEDVDPVRQPHGKAVAVDQFFAAARSARGAGLSLLRNRLIRDIDRHGDSKELKMTVTTTVRFGWASKQAWLRDRSSRAYATLVLRTSP
jgi:hypothetical protein